MKKNFFFGIIIIELIILIGVVYSRFIIPHLTNYPLNHDIASDYIGAQALLDPNEELYPILTPAFERIGIIWGAYHRSTHPPTAYLLVLPLTPFDYPLAQLIWMTMMFACIVLTFRVLYLSWRLSVLAGILSLAWPPTIWSLGQLTPIWLLGLALAYHHRDLPLISGINIAIAALPKFMAAPSILYHLWRRKWSVLIGFILVWMIALGIILIIRPDAIAAYISSNQTTSIEQILRKDNSAILIYSMRLFGLPGVFVVACFLVYVAWVGLKNNGFFGWACLVWFGIALLPIAWVYSLFPLLPWLIKAVRSADLLPRILSIMALLLPYLAPIPTYSPWAVTLSMLLSGAAFLIASSNEVNLFNS